MSQSGIINVSNVTPAVLETLTGNTGGAVPPTNNNINTVTANSTVKIVGNPATSTLTMDFAANNNVLLGTSGPSITSATNNTSLGFQSFPAVSSATQCTAVGFQSLQSVSTGSYNTALGSQCLKSVVGSSQNCGFGVSAGSSNTDGTDNVFVGFSTASQLPHGVNNVIVGSQAGSNLLGTANNNTLIGYKAGSNYVLNESNNILIGANIAGTASENNVVRIGNSSTSSCFIAGIEGVGVSNAQYVTINTATNQLGSTPITSVFTYTNVNHAASPYTVLATDYYISVDTSAGAVTLNFPNAPTAKQTWIVKDRTGTSSTSNITITTPGGTVTIDGATSYKLASNYAAINILANATPTYEIF